MIDYGLFGLLQVVKDAEEYYRQMFREDVSSWNLRGWFESRFNHTKAILSNSPPSSFTSLQLDLVQSAADSHMVDTLFSLQSHLSTPNGPKAKIVVWAHNSHLGDASATSMGARGEHNVGMLVRRAKGEKAVLVGFTTWGGTVTAGTLDALC